MVSKIMTYFVTVFINNLERIREKPNIEQIKRQSGSEESSSSDFLSKDIFTESDFSEDSENIGLYFNEPE